MKKIVKIEISDCYNLSFQVQPEKLEDLEFPENQDFLVPLDKLVLEV